MKYDQFDKAVSGSTKAYQEKKIKFCKICRIRLSKYNHSKYCFRHILEEITKEELGKIKGYKRWRRFYSRRNDR